MPKSRILRAASGKQALELMTRSRPDLVLLDLMMPEMTGFEVIERMRQHPDLCDIPVVVLTAKTLNQEVITRLNRGVATVLGKGLFSADETLQHVEAALRRSHQANLETRRIVRCAMAYIHEHYMESLTRQDVADHVGYSPRHLDRCFNDEMGLTPMAYLNRFRLRQARRLLQSTSRSIGEIADAVGFSNSAYFSRVFKQEMGASPSEYRRSL
jgi:YesN/AraC family two-component response regulator